VVSLRNAKFNIKKLYIVLALRWVFYKDLRTDRDLCFILIGFYTRGESVYSAVRTDVLYKADYVSSLKS